MKNLLLTAILLFSATTVSTAESARPNVVFFLIDDLGYMDLGCYGSTYYQTPHIDALAKSGARFTQAYAACPVCSPTRASILTGKYPARMDTTDWFGAGQPDEWNRGTKMLPAAYVEDLPLEEFTLAEALKESGYSTFFAGKWHLGREGFHPEDQGFDINKGGHHKGSPPGGYFDPYKNPKLDNRTKGEHLPARLANETSQFIRDHKDKPFFAMLSFYSVHTPLQSRTDLKEKYERTNAVMRDARPVWGTEGERKVRLVQNHAVYAAMVEAMDAAVGKVLQTLEELGLADDTIIIFTSDNGGLSTSEGHPTSNLPLRAGKGWLYEGGIREPTLVRWPGVVPAGTVIDSPAISTDFYPTILEMTNTPLRPKQHLDGISLIPQLHGKKDFDNRTLYWHYPHYGNQGGSPSAAIREGHFKVIEFYEDNRVEMYDLDHEIGETTNIAEDQPWLLRDMLKKLHAWQKEVDAKFATSK
jgi:arylsulfatase A-like enzyme